MKIDAKAETIERGAFTLPHYVRSKASRRAGYVELQVADEDVPRFREALARALARKRADGRPESVMQAALLDELRERLQWAEAQARAGRPHRWLVTYWLWRKGAGDRLESKKYERIVTSIDERASFESLLAASGWCDRFETKALEG